MDFFLPKGTNTATFWEIDDKYFQSGIDAAIFSDNSDIDISEESNQYVILDHFDKLQRGYLCEKAWIEKNQIKSWYLEYLKWIDAG